MSKWVKINAMSFALMMDALTDDACSIPELMEHTGLHVTTVRDYTRELHKLGVIHIAAWEKDDFNRYNVRFYALGRKKDVPKPAPSKGSVRAKAYRAAKQNRLIPFAIAGVLA